MQVFRGNFTFSCKWIVNAEGQADWTYCDTFFFFFFGHYWDTPSPAFKLLAFLRHFDPAITINNMNQKYGKEKYSGRIQLLLYLLEGDGKGVKL